MPVGTWQKFEPFVQAVHHGKLFFDLDKEIF